MIYIWHNQVVMKTISDAGNTELSYGNCPICGVWTVTCKIRPLDNPDERISWEEHDCTKPKRGKKKK